MYLPNHFEEARFWKMTDSSPGYIDQMLSNIVDIEFEIKKMVGKWKLSQNKEERDRVNAPASGGPRKGGIIATPRREA